MNYAEIYERCYGHLSPDKKAIDYFFELLGERGGPVVELGAGTGRLARLYRDQALTLIESSQDMLPILNHVVRLNQLPHAILQRERFRLPFEDGTVAGVYLSLNTLGELRPLSFSLVEIGRVLQDGGILHFTMENPRSVERRRPGYIRSVPGFPSDTYRLSMAPCLNIGEFGFSTELEYSGESEFLFCISQLLPDLASLERALKAAHLQVCDGFGSYALDRPANDDTNIFSLYCRKEKSTDSKVKFERLRGFYDSMADKYDAIAEAGSYRVPDELISETQELKQQRLRVLDLGCGNGFLGSALRQNQYEWRFFGIDFSEEMIERCRAKRVYEAEMQADLNFGIPVIESNVFDVVLACGVLEFVESPVKVLADIHRVLHKGGIGLLTFEMTGPRSLKQGEEQATGLRKFHYTQEQVAAMLKEAGFTVETHKTFEAYLSPTLHEWIPYHLLKVRKS